MIAYLKGKNIASDFNYLILEVNNVGYKVFTAEKNIPKIGDMVTLFTHNHIKEDCDDLYGFSQHEELKLFEKLITVNGVGPKVALTIMASFEYEDIIQAIINENISLFQSVSGIGKKVATKIILDLKTKLSSEKTGNVLVSATKNDEVFEALTMLGYKNSEVANILMKMPNLKTSEEKIRWSLKNLSK